MLKKQEDLLIFYRNLQGRLVSDPRLNGKILKKKTEFTIEVNRQDSKDNSNKTYFVNVVAFKQVAKFVLKHGKKGNMMAVQGRVKCNNYKQTVYIEIILTDGYTDRVMSFKISKPKQIIANTVSIPCALREELQNYIEIQIVR